MSDTNCNLLDHGPEGKTITFKASDRNYNQVIRDCPKQAVSDFLKRYKSRKFDVCELRDGVFTMIIGAHDPNACFRKSFESRADAKAYVEAA